MTELVERIKAVRPRSIWLLIPVLFLLIVLLIALFLTMQKPPPVEEPPPPSEEPVAAPPVLVTAEQVSMLSYTDSALGKMSWELSEESLAELNRVLLEYDITSAEEIAHFLAQATVETGAGRQLTELGDEDYFNAHGYTAGTRGAGYFHLTYEYGQMAFATWMMKKYVPELALIEYVSPANHGETTVALCYYRALQLASNLGLDVSEYSRIVYSGSSPVVTGADYIANRFAWESAAYYWNMAGISEALASETEWDSVDVVSQRVGGTNWQSRREAYEAFYPVLSGQIGES